MTQTGNITSTIHERLEALSRAVWNGASNPSLIRRAEKIADDLDGSGHGDLAARLRTALTRRGESLGARHDRVQQIAADFYTKAQR